MKIKNEMFGYFYRVKIFENAYVKVEPEKIKICIFYLINFLGF